MIPRTSSEVILLLGSNIGDRKKWLDSAITNLTESTGIVVEESRIYESEPWGFNASTPFLNQAIRLRTELGPRSLLHAIWEIELALGRQRVDGCYTSRSIDIDILAWGERIFWTRKLQVPHIQLQKRKFALLPLVDLAGTDTHPLLRKTYSELLTDCADSTWVKLYEPSHV